jgi:hypothetical protein
MAENDGLPCSGGHYRGEQCWTAADPHGPWWPKRRPFIDRFRRNSGMPAQSNAGYGLGIGITGKSVKTGQAREMALGRPWAGKG